MPILGKVSFGGRFSEAPNFSFQLLSGDASLDAPLCFFRADFSLLFQRLKRAALRYAVLFHTIVRRFRKAHLLMPRFVSSSQFFSNLGATVLTSSLSAAQESSPPKDTEKSRCKNILRSRPTTQSYLVALWLALDVLKLLTNLPSQPFNSLAHFVGELLIKLSAFG